MKKLLPITILLFSFHSFANCNVYIPEKSLRHESGYSIHFDFYNLLEQNGYVEVYQEEEADSVLRIKATELTGRFHKAQAEISLGQFKVIHKVTCYTQFCSFGSYVKSFNKAYRKMKKALPHCEG